MIGGPGDGDTNEIAIANNAIGRIKVNPARAGQVSLHPGVGRTAARKARIVAWNEDVSADEASGDAKRSRCFHHQNSEVAATAATALKCFVGRLYALLDAPAV